MLSKCLNPQCSASFRYLREGRVFNVERPCSPQQPGPAPYRTEFVWLCQECSRTLQVVTRNGDLCIVPRDPRKRPSSTVKPPSSISLL